MKGKAAVRVAVENWRQRQISRERYDSSPKYRLRIRSPEKGMTEHRLVRAELAGLHWPLGVPKKATYRSSV